MTSSAAALGRKEARRGRALEPTSRPQRLVDPERAEATGRIALPARDTGELDPVGHDGALGRPAEEIARL
jgi:hypothetical protein